MARSFDYKGLLYSPEVLGGIGLLTAGLSGKAPDTALPMMMQGMKTASMFSAMEKEEEKKRLIEQYADKVPEDQKALFKAFPLEYLKKYEFAKDKAAKFQTFMNADGEKKTINVSTKSGEAEANALLEKGWNTISQSITGKSTDDLTKKSMGKTEETIIGGNELLANLENQKLLFKDEFLDYKGKLKYELLLKKDKAAGFTGVPLTIEERQYVNSYSAWQQTNLQYFNNYRKLITGVAAGEREIGWLQESIPSELDTPNTYRAKLDNQIRIQKQLIENAEKFKATKGKIYNENGEYSEEYINYLKGKVKPNGEYLESRIKAYVIDNGYDEDTIYGILDGEFKGTNWREILKIYLSAKGGSL
jgi:hypothetical protein